MKDVCGCFVGAGHALSSREFVRRREGLRQKRWTRLNFQVSVLDNAEAVDTGFAYATMVRLRAPRTLISSHSADEIRSDLPFLLNAFLVFTETKNQ